MIEAAIDTLTTLLQGGIPAEIDTEGIPEEGERRLAARLNQLIDFIQEAREAAVPLSRGELQQVRIRSSNFLASPFKELHSRLQHLTWQARQVAAGDYNQRIDFMGDLSEAFNSMVVALDRNEKLLRDKIDELRDALSRINRLEGILPICSKCKKIRIEGGDPEEQDSWVQIEEYLSHRTDAQFSHSICPECLHAFYPGYDS